MTSPSSFFVTPWVRRLLAANVVVYLLSVTVFTGLWFANLVAFSPAGAADRPWTFGTYLFAHAGLLHLAVNMLVLLMFGPAVERRMGRYHHRQPALELVREVIAERWRERITSHQLVDFNNHPATTMADLRIVLQVALERATAQAQSRQD